MLLTFCVLIVLGTKLYWFWQCGHVIDGSESDRSSTELRCESSLLASETLQLNYVSVTVSPLARARAMLYLLCWCGFSQAPVHFI